MSLDADEAVDALRAAGEPTRLRILALLAVEELTVMELGRILDQSQPRVSRHLTLETDRGRTDRAASPTAPGCSTACRRTACSAVALRLEAVLDPVGRRGRCPIATFQRLDERVRTRREAEADPPISERIAPRWGEIRSLYAPEGRVEAAVEEAAGPGPFDRVVDLGTGSGRMLTLLGARAKSVEWASTCRNRC